MDAAPITVLVCALGGEGGGVLSEWLYELAVRCGHSAQATSIPGVAQRTGATTYYIEICPLADEVLGGLRPVFSLNPVPGAIDLLVSSELLETARQAGLGMASAERTTVLTSSARALTVAERMPLGDGRLDAAALRATVQRHSRRCEVIDMAALAREAGTVISAVLFGAIAGSGVLPFAREACEATIRAGGTGVEASLRGFALGFAAVQRAAAPAASIESAGAAERPLPELDTLLALGRERLADYQDAAYGELFAGRVERLRLAEQASDPGAEHDARLTREAARWLVLWMAFDDIVRVAALKLRADRLERVRREVGAREDELVRVFDHFKPGVAEFAALLPAALARRLVAWDERRIARGRAPWALPIRLATHGVRGALALRLLASLRGWRRRGERFAAEQALIERWLAAVEQGAREHWALGHELACCGRLVKGYGSTNERGKRNLLHIVDHLARADHLPDPAARAAAVRAARTAALADEAGRGLDQALVAHGAPPRTPRAQPIRWHRRRPDTPATGAPRSS
ncbi:MAG: indolepyruvate oxidoreductase subunit beta family protein [Piscinibacter sp.]|nr:indolepyruvate oxidoreductase subunit beta family protein [Piscinibacter sp.]